MKKILQKRCSSLDAYPRWMDVICTGIAAINPDFNLSTITLRQEFLLQEFVKRDHLPSLLLYGVFLEKDIEVSNGDVTEKISYLISIYFSAMNQSKRVAKKLASLLFKYKKDVRLDCIEKYNSILGFLKNKDNSFDEEDLPFVNYVEELAKELSTANKDPQQPTS